ncbi:MAG TPA: sensor histidine kinase [Blastocatellia bacterium]|nr:sensor histidine kinase [Blastocatellia bacterium]
MNLIVQDGPETTRPTIVGRREQMEAALRDLGGRLISVQEEERRRIACELHDDLSQRMALLSIELEQLAQQVPRRQAQLHMAIGDLLAKAREISSDIHRLAYQLHPARLEHFGLERAVKGLCDELARRHEYQIEFHHHGFPAILPREMMLCFYRVAQESLSNVIKHSGSREARVVLERMEQSICLSVSDLGRGFDPESDQAQRGLGLLSMRERVRCIGGDLSIYSQPFSGTQIIVLVPLTRHMEET